MNLLRIYGYNNTIMLSVYKLWEFALQILISKWFFVERHKVIWRSLLINDSSYSSFNININGNLMNEGNKQILWKMFSNFLGDFLHWRQILFLRTQHDIYNIYLCWVVCASMFFFRKLFSKFCKDHRRSQDQQTNKLQRRGWWLQGRFSVL